MKKVKFSVPSDEEMLSQLSLGVWQLSNRLNRRFRSSAIDLAFNDAISALNRVKFWLKYVEE